MNFPTSDNMAVLNNQANIACAELNGISFQITQNATGAWRIQQVVNNQADNLGASQILAEEFDGGGDSSLNKLSIKTEECLSVIEGLNSSSLLIKADGIVLRDSNGLELTTINAIDITADVAKIKGSLNAAERLYGTGERFNKINQRGYEVDIWSEDKWCHTEGNSYMPIPFIISSHGYGLFMNRFEASKFDLGKADPNQWEITLHDAPIDLYLFAGTPAEIIDQYTELTGRTPLPAEWTFGIHVCRHVRKKEFSTKEGVREMMKQMAAHKLPWHSAIIEGWDAYSPKTYQDLKELTQEINASDRKVLVYEAAGRIWHWLSENPPEYYSEALKAKPEYFVADDTGNIIHTDTLSYNPLDAPCIDDKQPVSSYVDLTNPVAWKWWLDVVSDPIHKVIGSHGAKIDFCEQFPETSTLKFHNGASPKGMHHLYPVLFNTKMYKYYNENHPDGGLCFSRGGGIGSQRYPMLWAGDQRREWDSLQAILKASLSSGLCGVPFMCHDLAGYIPAIDHEKNIEKDVFVRGTQFACFGPNMQTHGMVTKPYDFDAKTVDIYRLYSKIHCALMPYLAQQAKVATENGLPLMRHLIIDFPQDAQVFDIEDQYMLGEDFMVAPILEAQNSRSVYLPEGQWLPLLGGEMIEGPILLENIEVPMAEVLVYVKEPANDFVNTIVKEIQVLTSNE